MKLKVKTLFLLVLCLARFVIFGKAKAKKREIKKVLIFQGAKLGDMVCTTPMFRAIKKKYPTSTVIVVGNAVNEKLLDHNPDVDRYIIYDEKSIFTTFKKVKKEEVDAGCVTGPSFLTLAILYLAGIPLVVAPVVKNGWSPWETKSYKILSRFVYTEPHHMGKYAPREYLRLLEPMDIFTDDTKKHLNYSEEAGKKAEVFLQHNSILKEDLVVGLLPSAGNRIKEWPTERFARVADHLIEKYKAKVVCIGGPNDSEKVQSVLKNVKHSDVVINTQGQFNIDEIKALVSRLSLFISVDTGPIYIAEAFNIPTVDITGPIDEREQPPQGPLHRNVIPPKREKPELSVLNARMYNKAEALRQLKSITVSAVITETDELIRDIRTEAHK